MAWIAEERQRLVEEHIPFLNEEEGRGKQVERRTEEERLQREMEALQEEENLEMEIEERQEERRRLLARIEEKRRQLVDEELDEEARRRGVLVDDFVRSLFPKLEFLHRRELEKTSWVDFKGWGWPPK